MVANMSHNSTRLADKRCDGLHSAVAACTKLMRAPSSCTQDRKAQCCNFVLLHLFISGPIFMDELVHFRQEQTWSRRPPESDNHQIRLETEETRQDRLSRLRTRQGRALGEKVPLFTCLFLFWGPSATLHRPDLSEIPLACVWPLAWVGMQRKGQGSPVPLAPQLLKDIPERLRGRLSMPFEEPAGNRNAWCGIIAS